MYYPELQIKNGGSWTASAGSSTGLGKWTLSADETLLSMTIDGTSREMKGTITKLTSAELVIEVKLNESDPLGLLPFFTYSSVLKYSRNK